MAFSTTRAAMTSIVTEAEVCVIGAGVMGLSAAYRLAMRGFDVLVLERSYPGLEASAANAGTIALQNKPIRSIPLGLHSVRLWRSLADEWGEDTGYERRGGLRLAHTDEDVAALHTAVEVQRSHGMAVEIVDRPTLERDAPYLARSVQAASYCPDDGMANPLATVRALLKTCARSGVRVWSRHPVNALEPGADGYLVGTPNGSVRARIVVSATGAWSRAVAQLVGISVPVRAEVLQVMTTDDAPALFPHIITHIRGNLTLKQAAVTGRVLIGGGWRGEGDPTTGTKRVSRESLLGNLQTAIDAVPGLARARVLRAWAGFEGRTSDRLLMVGAVPSLPGLFMLGCASGGFTFAPVAGVMLAALVAGAPADLPFEPFDLRRLVSEAGIEYCERTH